MGNKLFVRKKRKKKLVFHGHPIRHYILRVQQNIGVMCCAYKKEKIYKYKIKLGKNGCVC